MVYSESLQILNYVELILPPGTRIDPKKDTTILEVREIYKDSVLTSKWGKGEILKLSYNEINPFVVNSKRLIKLGFKRSGEDTYYQMYKDIYRLEGVLTNKGFICLLGHATVTIKEIHTLQNLWRALTGGLLLLAPVFKPT